MKAGDRVTRHRVQWFCHFGAILLALEAGGFGTAVARGQDSAAGALMFSIALSQGVADRLSVGDIRPEPRGEWGGHVGLDYQFSERWAASLAGQVGGSWFDFNGFAVSGKLVDASWSARAGVDRLVRAGGGSTVFIGIGLEYGEARSWLDNLTISQEGPHNYLAGGSVRIGISCPPLARFQLYGDLLQSFYKGHARDETSGTKYNWLGRSLTATLGVKFQVTRGRPRVSRGDGAQGASG